MTVTLHKVCGGKSLTWVLHLRVREGEPYLLYFAFREETVYYFYVGSQECYILQAQAECLCCTSPHACSLDVNTDKVLVGVTLRQAYGIFSSAAAKFKNDRVVIMEVLFAPMPFHLKRYVVNYAVWILEHVLISFHVGEFRQFAFSHLVYVVYMIILINCKFTYFFFYIKVILTKKYANVKYIFKFAYLVSVGML